MKKRIKTIYHSIVNLNQWFTYGRNWLLVPFTILSNASSISILLIYFKVEQDFITLVFWTTIVSITALILGIVLFVSKGQQVDTMLQRWKSSPYTEALALAQGLGLIELFKMNNTEFPEEMKELGAENWDDLKKVIHYSMSKGRNTYAIQLCRKFFES